VSIANRLARLLRAVKAEDVVMLTGGMAMDDGLIAALAEELETRGKRRKNAPTLRLRAHEHSILAGAIGAALIAAFRYQQLEERGRLEEIVGAAAAPA
jgi:activator of 2-hydroxyglutaryl-CoA dehydratase